MRRQLHLWWQTPRATLLIAVCTAGNDAGAKHHANTSKTQISIFGNFHENSMTLDKDNSRDKLGPPEPQKATPKPIDLLGVIWRYSINNNWKNLNLPSLSSMFQRSATQKKISWFVPNQISLPRDHPQMRLPKSYCITRYPGSCYCPLQTNWL